MTDNNTTELINKIVNYFVEKVPELKGCVSVVITDDLTEDENKQLSYDKESIKLNTGRSLPVGKYFSARVCLNEKPVKNLFMLDHVDFDAVKKLYNRICIYGNYTTAEIRHYVLDIVWTSEVTNQKFLTNVLNKLTADGYKIHTVNFSQTEDSVYVLAHAPVIVTGSGN